MNNEAKVSDMDNILFKDEIIPETKVRAERENLDINNEKSKQYKIKRKEELQKLVNDILINDISDADIKMLKDEIEKVIVDTNDKLARGIIEDFISRVYIANHYPDLSNTSAEEVYYMLRKKLRSS